MTNGMTMPSSKNRHVFVDADGLLYIAAAVGEKVEYECVFETPQGALYQINFQKVADINEHLADTGDELLAREKLVTPQPLSWCLQVAKIKMEEMKQRYGSDLRVFLKGDGTNYRDQVATLHTYKGNRTNDKPIYLDEVRQYLIENWNAIPVSGKEADDEIALQASWSSKPYVICSPDKDLDQIPGLHWDYKKQVEYEVSDDEARAFFWTQVLCGDNADNIKGCWQVGMGAAAKIINECLEEDCTDEEIWQTICEQYELSTEKQGCPYVGMPPELVALENARLVWMQTEERRLWTPPGQPAEYLEDSWD